MENFSPFDLFDNGASASTNLQNHPSEHCLRRIFLKTLQFVRYISERNWRTRRGSEIRGKEESSRLHRKNVFEVRLVLDIRQVCSNSRWMKGYAGVT